MSYTLHQIATSINAAQPRWHVDQSAVLEIIDSACGVPMGSKIPRETLNRALRQHWLFYWVAVRVD